MQVFADLGEGAGGVVLQAEALADHGGLPLAELLKQRLQIIVELLAGEFLLRGGVVVLQEVAEVHALVAAHPHIQRHGPRLPFQGEAHHRFAEVELGGHFPDGGTAAEAGREQPLGPSDAVEFFGDVDGKADGAALAGDPPVDSLADPPVGVGAEAEAPGGIESLHRPLQPQGALLHQVEQLHAALQVFLGHGHHQPQVGLDHPLLGAAPLVQGQAQFGGGELAAVSPARKVAIALLLQQPFAPLYQPGQGELLFGGQQVDPANLLEVLPHQIGGGGARQGCTPESLHPAQSLR